MSPKKQSFLFYISLCKKLRNDEKSRIFFAGKFVPSFNDGVAYNQIHGWKPMNEMVRKMTKIGCICVLSK